MVRVAEEKELADCQQAEIEHLQRKVSELQGELKSELKQHSRATDSDAHVCITGLDFDLHTDFAVHLFRPLLLFATSSLFVVSRM